MGGLISIVVNILSIIYYICGYHNKQPHAVLYNNMNFSIDYYSFIFNFLVWSVLKAWFFSFLNYNSACNAEVKPGNTNFQPLTISTRLYLQLARFRPF